MTFETEDESAPSIMTSMDTMFASAHAQTANLHTPFFLRVNYIVSSLHAHALAYIHYDRRIWGHQCKLNDQNLTKYLQS